MTVNSRTVTVSLGWRERMLGDVADLRARSFDLRMIDDLVPELAGVDRGPVDVRPYWGELFTGRRLR